MKGYKAFNKDWKCKDFQYSGVAMEINYCPICGRKLNGE